MPNDDQKKSAKISRDAPVVEKTPAPPRMKTHVASQDDPGTDNLQQDDFGEIGHSLEGLKDSPLDEGSVTK